MYRFMRLTLAVVLAGIVLVGPASAAPAGTVVGNGTPLTCTEGVFDAAVAAGGNVTFNCGGPLTIVLTNPAPVTSDQTTIDGGNAITLTSNLKTPLLIVGTGSRLTLSNIVLDRGYAKNGDGGAIASTGDVTLDHVRIQGSVADEFGGAIYSLGDLTIQNSTLASNSAGSGGAIYALSVNKLKIVDSTLMFNTALNPTTGIGGAIELAGGSQLMMIGGSLHNNLAPVQGGAVDMESNSSATFAPSSAGGTWMGFNSAQGYGGAISNNGGLLTLQDAVLEFNSTLTNSVAIGFGGAIDDEGRMIVHNSIFNTNRARFGGAIFVGGSLFTDQADIQQTHFIGNFAAQFGGALYTNEVTTTVTIENSNIEFNKAAYGGGIARTDAHLSIAQSSITSNVAQNGGGLGLQALPDPTDGPYVEIHDTTISGNLSTSGFGGGINNSGLLDMVNVTIAGNHQGLYDTRAGTIARLQNSVLDNPPGLNCGGDGTLPSSAGNNYSTDTSCSLSGFHDTEGAGLNAMLGTLNHDNSFTNYQMPQPGSPLINQAGPGCSATDQIYALRSGACDIGAVEFGGLLPRIFVPLVRK